MIAYRGQAATFTTAPYAGTTFVLVYEVRDPTDTVVASGPADATDDPTVWAATYTPPLDADTTADWLIQWGGTVDGAPIEAHEWFRVSDGHYFTEAEARATDPVLESLTTEQVERIRDEVEDEVEALCGVAFVPRLVTERIHDCDGRPLLLSHMLPRSVVSARIYSDATTYTTLTPTELADVVLLDHGEARRSTLGSWCGRSVELTYEHGHDEPPPRVKRAALALFRWRATSEHWRLLADSAVVDAEGNTTVEGVNAGTARDPNARKGKRTTGIPEIDLLLMPELDGAGIGVG